MAALEHAASAAHREDEHRRTAAEERVRVADEAGRRRDRELAELKAAARALEAQLEEARAAAADAQREAAEELRRVALKADERRQVRQGCFGEEGSPGRGRGEIYKGASPPLPSSPLRTKLTSRHPLPFSCGASTRLILDRGKASQHDKAAGTVVGGRGSPLCQPRAARSEACVKGGASRRRLRAAEATDGGSVARPGLAVTWRGGARRAELDAAQSEEVVRWRRQAMPIASMLHQALATRVVPHRRYFRK